ncbi:hypothetical protein [Dasychira pudibunda nucleopolyhedrovirus]|nr:hypothetical protein [Dasychira pudibunda nucleopolyhedrovirus]WHM28345.1 hypothetical protein [Dasychira pudibunda nucleopolyhedrovirus]
MFTLIIADESIDNVAVVFDRRAEYKSTVQRSDVALRGVNAHAVYYSTTARKSCLAHNFKHRQLL